VSVRVPILGVTTGLGRHIAEAVRARGGVPVGLIRGAAHVDALRAAGIEPIVLDTDRASLPERLRAAVHGADAVVLAAGTGTGPGSLGAATARTSPASLLIGAAEAAGVRRYVMVSALLPGAHDRTELGDRLGAYLAEKVAAERALRDRELDWCVLRPGLLTEEPPTGLIRASPGGTPVEGDEIGRADCARAVVAVLDDPAIRGVWQVCRGGTPIATAFRSFVR
jgi:uncharacterized protein YbjT (DUF2867 family)